MLFAGQDIDRSPFIVNVSKAMGDPTRVQARGPGLQQTGNVAGKPTYFDIYTAGEEMGEGTSHTCISSRARLGPSLPVLVGGGVVRGSPNPNPGPEALLKSSH